MKYEKLRYGSTKAYIDGSIGSHSAWFHKCYEDTPDYQGDNVESEENLYKLVKEADELGLQLFVHAIGDKGINTVLNIFERVAKENGFKDRRWRIEHS